MLYGEAGDLAIMRDEWSIEPHKQCIGPFLHHCGQCAGKVARLQDAETMYLHSERAGGILDSSCTTLCSRTYLSSRSIEESDACHVGNDFLHELEPLHCEVDLQNRISSQVPARAGKAGHEPASHRVSGRRHDNRNGHRRLLRRTGPRRTVRHDHIDLKAYQLGRESRQPIIMLLGPPILDDEVPALFVAEFPQSLAHGGNLARPARRVDASQETDAVNLSGLLRTNGERRGENTESNTTDESTAVHHWITSSARSSNGCGIVSPSAFAVLRLMMSSNVLACPIGRSPGFAPLRMRST